MDTKQLRQKILDLAIRGKLVPQDPKDEPASVLLERVKAEKERLIAEGKIKRSKKSAVSSDKPHYPFEIPDSWEWIRLEDFVLAVTDGDHFPPPQAPSGIPFLVISDVNTGRISFDKARFVSECYYKALPEIRKAKEGDLLFTVTGSYGIVIPVNTNRKFCFQRHIGLIKTITSSSWIRFVLQSNYVQSYCDSIATGTAQKTVSLGHLRNLIIPIPPEKEQVRIINELELWLKKVEIIQRNECDLKRLLSFAKSIILDLSIHGNLVPQDPADEPAVDLLKRVNLNAVVSTDTSHYNGQNLPNGWIQCKFSDLFNVRSARRVHKADWRSEGIPFYRAREIGKLSDLGTVDNDLYIDNLLYSEFAKSGLPQSGDIMITAVGTLGKTYIVRKGDKFYYKDGSVLCIENRNGIDPRYIEMFISSSHFKEQYIWESQGTTVATLTMDRINSYSFVLPPLNEQKRIVSKVDELFAVIDQIKQSLE